MNLPRTRRGERHPNARLTWPLVKEARKLAAEDVTLKEIHQRLRIQVSVEALRQAIRGDTWGEEEPS